MKRLWLPLASTFISLAPPVPVLLILGHMRSGSTLLLHLLLTSPELIACGERNAAYRSHRDLDGLVAEARVAQRAPLRRFRYAVDQVNHSRFTPNIGLLRDPRVRLVFLVREPVPTLHSILKLSRAYYRAKWSVDQAVDYYCERLRTLAELAGVLGAADKSMTLSYVALVDDTEETLRRLETFLGLETELSEKYSLQRFTGTRGDPTECILAGRIVRDRVTPLTGFSPGDLERATEAYHTFQRATGSRR